MFDTAGRAFFAALRDVAERRLGRDHVCFRLADQAAATGDAASTEAAQSALNELEPALLGEIMADTHKALRENPAALLGAWPAAGARH